MYALAEYGAFLVLMLLGGGFSFVLIAAILIILEGVNAATRTLRVR